MTDEKERIRKLRDQIYDHSPAPFSQQNRLETLLLLILLRLEDIEDRLGETADVRVVNTSDI